jgi:hypothetical protein
MITIIMRQCQLLRKIQTTTIITAGITTSPVMTTRALIRDMKDVKDMAGMAIMAATPGMNSCFATASGYRWS